MEIRFQTKEESNTSQEQEFLKLTGIERFYAFLNLSYRLRNLPVKNKRKSKNNFEIVINRG
ncbi:hypothetical protein KFE94_12730 [bacterium SCSIO 12643]|nr:hypothetical protein KFE94_12730 [bacterium SCSIO 12643]